MDSDTGCFYAEFMDLSSSNEDECEDETTMMKPFLKMRTVRRSMFSIS